MDLLQRLKLFEPLWGAWYVDRYLGEGSQGKVFLMHKDAFDGRYTSALKLIHLPREKASPLYASGSDSVEAIVNEIRHLYRLRGHSHIVNYEDHEIFQEPDGLYIFIRMEYLTSLSTLLKEEAFTLDMFFQLAMDMCSALAVCHGQQTLHRDIKIGNIFRAPNQQFKLGDFGIAKTLTDNVSAHTRIGTPLYMAPEVIQTLHYDQRADIYSLGIVLYTLLHDLRLPFAPDFPEKVTSSHVQQCLQKKLSGEVPSLPRHTREKFKVLGEIILKCIAFQSEQRFLQSKELKKHLYEIYKSLSDADKASILHLPETIPAAQAPTPSLPQENAHVYLEETACMTTAHPPISESPLASAVHWGNLANGGLITQSRDGLYISHITNAFCIFKQTFDEKSIVSHDYAWYLQIHGENLYYINESDTGKIYKYPGGQGHRFPISQQSAQQIAVLDNTLYFTEKQTRRCYAQNLVNACKEIVCSDTVYEFVIWQDHFIYRNAQGEIRLSRLNNTTAFSRIHDAGRFLILFENDLYFLATNENHRLYRFDLNNQTLLPYDLYDIAYFNVNHKNIFFVSKKDDYRLQRLDRSNASRLPLPYKACEYLYLIGEKLYFFQTQPKKQFLYISADQ